MPLPYTEEAPAHLVSRSTQVPDFLGQRILDVGSLNALLGFSDAKYLVIFF